MRVLKADDGETIERSDAVFQQLPVWSRETAGPAHGDQFISGVISFAPGSRTRMHTHTTDQLLYIVSGIGNVGTHDQVHTVSAGDFIVIPAGEPHWHGAGDTGSPMSHLMVTGAGQTTEVVGDAPQPQQKQ